MPYSEMAYFEGYHFQHIADWLEQKRIERIRANAIRLLDRRKTRR